MAISSGVNFQAAGAFAPGVAVKSVMHRWSKDFENALKVYGGVMENYKGTIFAQDAEIYTAISYRDKGDTAQAITAYANFVKNWPESGDIDYANGQVRKLRGE